MNIKHLLQQQLAQIEQSEAAAEKSQVGMLPPLSPVPQTPQLGIQQAISTEVARQVNLLKADLLAQPKQEPPKVTNNMIQAAAFQLFNASLKPAEMAWLQEHYMTGYHGFAEFLQSDSIKTVIQMGFEAYKDFLEGKAK